MSYIVFHLFAVSMLLLLQTAASSQAGTLLQVLGQFHMQ
jgi:hypothetical protein